MGMHYTICHFFPSFLFGFLLYRILENSGGLLGYFLKFVRILYIYRKTFKKRLVLCFFNYRLWVQVL